MKLSAERKRQRAALVRLCVFLTVAGVVTVWVAAITAQYRSGDSAVYRAVFGDVSGLSVGDAVRVAGVDVGKVKQIDVEGDNSVVVVFALRSDQELSTATRATIQYRNLTGDRVVQLSQGRPGAASLPQGGTIPESHTAAALDLDTLLNGFRPLFAGLTPAQINELSGEVVQVLQGQQAAVSTLVSHVASFTSTIGTRQQVIGRVIRNLNSVVTGVDQHSGALGQLIEGLDHVVVGLDKQDGEVLTAAARVAGFARVTSTLLASARGSVRTDLAALLVAARGINQNTGTLRQVLAALPQHYRAMQDTASYGNFYNTFLCAVRVETDLGTSPWIRSGMRRCAS